jgi:hypothetical protein
MARVAKSGGGTLQKPLPVPPSSPFVEWFFRPAMLFRMSLVAGVFALWPYAAQRLPSLNKRPEYRLTFRQIQITPRPEGSVPENLIEQVEKLAGLSRELSVLDDNLTSEIANAFRKHPWVSNVVRVQKSFPASVVVQLEYRRPVAMVQVAGGRVPIDIDAIVLPTDDFSTSDFGRYPLIQNVTSKPAARPGIAWSDPALLAAARLASLLGEKWTSLKLEAISIPRNLDPSLDINDISLELQGIGGSRILWGRTPGSDHPGELEPAQKIRRLENYLADFGDYGQPNGPYEIDIRHWRENSRRPLISDQAPAKPSRNLKDDTRIQNTEGRRKTRS